MTPPREVIDRSTTTTPAQPRARQGRRHALPGRWITAARQARINAGLTVAEVARRMECSQERIRLAERVGGRCSFNTGRDLARIYGCDQMAFLIIGRPTGQPGD
jgi:hypothetical protein